MAYWFLAAIPERARLEMLAPSAIVRPDARRKLPKPDQVYLSESSAAMLWNGLVTGDGVNFRFINRGDIRKSYRVSDGNFQFGH